MNIEENYETGRPNEVFAILNHKIGQYKRNYKFVKIGITGQIPEERFEQHLKDYKWTKMVLIYKSSSINYGKLPQKLKRFEIESVKQKLYEKFKIYGVTNRCDFKASRRWHVGQRDLSSTRHQPADIF